MVRHTIFLGSLFLIVNGCHPSTGPTVNGVPSMDTVLEKMHYCKIVVSGVPAKYNTTYSSFSQMGSTNRSDTLHRAFYHSYEISDTLKKIHEDTISFTFLHRYGIMDCSNAYGTHTVTVSCVIDEIHSLINILDCQDYSSLMCGYPGGGSGGGSNTDFDIASVFPDPIPFHMAHDSLIGQL